MILINHQLSINADDKILIPGCEPISELTSVVLASFVGRNGCCGSYVNLDDALVAIPGSYVKFGVNYNRGVYTQRWFVLPAINDNCPCETYDDYYRILKEISCEEEETEEVFDFCNINNMGFCPSPDFENIEAPPADPYKPEGSFPPSAGVLPPVPPWMFED